MEAPTVPAWKRLGLRVKETIENDPLSIDSHYTASKPKDTSLSKRKTDELNTSSEAPDELQKKPPKRPKIPKSERKPPPESDQLVYLKSYSLNKKEWKFSKSKQNWILRHIYNQTVIPETYSEYLINYLVGIQGGVTKRIVEDAKRIIEEWNNFMTEEDKVEKNEIQSDLEKNDSKEIEDTKKKETKSESLNYAPPTEASARIAQKIILKLDGNHISLALIDKSSEQEQ
ncbi:uncharacterized protein SAPINGB_P003305 [Magnusiomyces paraingens]|uniref:WKF domain-containing protein n=1 Tax=Magnusiomyces paraingens TaxID=2606893 RepID=A0A5E8BME9_9ASCO|nr:uncharacterized protein SAPINGB_P003305 [Saprochaete ingens]VVT52064.1 unnamed protein product [Saprochaete ingens]